MITSRVVYKVFIFTRTFDSFLENPSFKFLVENFLSNLIYQEFINLFIPLVYQSKEIGSLLVGANVFHNLRS